MTTIKNPEDTSSWRYLIINNVSKMTNVIQLIHTSMAYQFQPILVASPNIHASILPFLHLESELVWYETLEECKKFLQQKDIPLIGIEILSSAQPSVSFAFPTSIAIMPGNEGSGMNQKQIKQCDGLVYIPHYGYGTASLNVHIATTLIMNQYHVYHHTFDAITADSL